MVSKYVISTEELQELHPLLALRQLALAALLLHLSTATASSAWLITSRGWGIAAGHHLFLTCVLQRNFKYSHCILCPYTTYLVAALQGSDSPFSAQL